jgi:phosphoheptose isomerase
MISPATAFAFSFNGQQLRFCHESFARAIEDSVATLRSLSALEEPLDRAAQLILRSLTSGKKLLVCGNGGSASDATHLATEFLCRFRMTAGRIPRSRSRPTANS